MEMEANVVYTEAEVAEARREGLADSLEVAYSRLRFGRILGRGAFGCVVFLGTAHGLAPATTTVALKQLSVHAGEEERESFLREIEMMKRVGRSHPNIVALYGCVTLGAGPLCMVRPSPLSSVAA